MTGYELFIKNMKSNLTTRLANEFNSRIRSTGEEIPFIECWERLVAIDEIK